MTTEETLSTIERKRRMQIIESTIVTLANEGYVRTTLAKIASRAEITAGLIPYHFKNKDELMRRTLGEILSGWHEYVEEMVDRELSSTRKLAVYFTANFEYMQQRPLYFPALIEIVFNARDEKGVLLYRVPEDDPGIALLERILAEGQERGEFRDFDTHSVAIAIRATIDQVLGQIPVWKKFDTEQYIQSILELYEKAIIAVPSRDLAGS